MNEETMYIIWSPTSNLNPKAKHPSIEEAITEAKRLAAKYPLQEFIVMRAISSWQYRTDPFISKNYCAKGR